MDYLLTYGYEENEINDLIKIIPETLKNALIKEADTVKINLDCLKELGISNLKNIFNSYYDMFLMDNDEFSDIFNKYDREDLIEKLEKNITIIEYL